MSKKKRKKRKLKRRHVKAFLYVSTILLIILLLIGLFIVGAYFLCPRDETKVKGNTILTKKEIISYCITGDYPDNAMYEFLWSRIKPTKNIPFVDSYKITFNARNSITINVTEKRLLGYLTLEDGTYAYFNDEGQVVEISDKLVDGVMPLIGLSSKEAKVGENLPIDEDQLKYILMLTKNLEKYDIDAQGIFFADNGDLCVILGTIWINFGDNTSLEDKCMRLPHVLPSLEGQCGILHLENYSAENTDIVFEQYGTTSEETPENE